MRIYVNVVPFCILHLPKLRTPIRNGIRISCKLLRLINNALKLYALRSDLMRTRLWQMPPTPSNSGFPRQDKPKTNSSKALLVNRTPTGKRRQQKIVNVVCPQKKKTSVKWYFFLLEWIENKAIFKNRYLRRKFFDQVNALRCASFEFNYVKCEL